MLKKTINEMMKDANTVPQPTKLTAPFDNDFLPNPLIKKPMKGKSGMSKIKFFISKL